MNVSGGWASASVAREPGSGSGVSVWVLWWTEQRCSRLVPQYLCCSLPPLVLFCVDTVVPCRGYSSHRQCVGATTANNTVAVYAVVNTGTRHVLLCTGTWFVAFYSLCLHGRSYGDNFYTELFEIIVGVQLSSGNSTQNSGNNHHLTIPFEGGMHSFKRQGACVSWNWRYESEPPFKPSPLTCYRQFGTNSIIVLMFVESQRVHI